jgi:hypothetical protein
MLYLNTILLFTIKKDLDTKKTPSGILCGVRASKGGG